MLKKHSDLKNHIHKRQGKTVLDEYAEKFLIDYYANEIIDALNDFKENPTNLNEFESNSFNMNDFDSNLLDLNQNHSNLLNVINILQKQLEVKDAQIKDLTESINTISLAFSEREKARQQELYLQALNAKDLLVNNQEVSGSQQEPKKRGLLHRFFKN